jgi:hypothetical protein
MMSLFAEPCDGEFRPGLRFYNRAENAQVP